MKNSILLLFIPICILSIAASTGNSNSTIDYTKKNYSHYLDSLSAWADNYVAILPNATNTTTKKEFIKGRLLYKNIEFLVEYHYPSTANKINGAPLLESKPSQPLEPKLPQGFQVLEEYVYDTLTKENRTKIFGEISNLKSSIISLKSKQKTVEYSEENIIDALRLNLYQMIMRGLSGFDAPAALSGIEESMVVLNNFSHHLRQFEKTEKLRKTTHKAIAYINKNQVRFNDFNRAIFIKDYLNPLCEAFYYWQLNSNIPFTKANRAINNTAKHLFTKNTFNANYFAPAATTESTKTQLKLGKKLFIDTKLSSTQQRSCSSCHQANKAFTDGLKLNETLISGEKLLRNTPTIINAALQPAQFYDSRIPFLEDQIHDVVTNKTEMDGNLNKIVTQLGKDKTYKELFQKAYPKELTNVSAVKKALAAYIRSLTNLNAPFDKYMRGNATAMNASQVNGLNIFIGKGKCATCHFLPLFNGSFPPYYSKIESEVLGVPMNTDTLNAQLDKDLGKYNLYQIPHQKFAFKTVGLRNVAKTAPYMHNGVYATLEEVIDFYDRGGGAGIGIALENQTLSPDRLNLNIKEKENLISFLEALSN